MDIYDITASALTAGRLRLDTISSNLANVNTTRNQDGTRGAYHRKNIVFAPVFEEAKASVSGMGGGLKSDSNGKAFLEAGLNQTIQGGVGVQVLEIAEDNKTPLRMVYDPSHPDANEKGFVEMPNINTVTEMVDMISASRAYEASITAFQAAKSMNESTLQM